MPSRERRLRALARKAAQTADGQHGQTVDAGRLDGQTADKPTSQNADVARVSAELMDVGKLKALAIHTLARNLGEGPPASQVAAARTLLEALAVIGSKGEGIKTNTAPASTLSRAAIAAELKAIKGG